MLPLQASILDDFVHEGCFLDLPHPEELDLLPLLEHLLLSLLAFLVFFGLLGLVQLELFLVRALIVGVILILLI